MTAKRVLRTLGLVVQLMPGLLMIAIGTAMIIGGVTGVLWI